MMKQNVRRTKWRASAMALLMLFGAIPVELNADSYRCGRKVVRTGDSSALLLQKCGEPRFKDRAYEEVKLKDGRKNVRVERWHYKKSTRSLSRSVLIYQGNIVGIETGAR